MFNPTLLAHFKAIKEFLSSSELDGYVTDGPLKSIVDAILNARVRGSNYEGTIDVRRAYHFNTEYGTDENLVKERSQFVKYQLQPVTLMAIVGLIKEMEPEFWAIVVGQNDDVEPAVLMPTGPPQPEPLNDPEPEPEAGEEQDEESTDPPGNEETPVD